MSQPKRAEASGALTSEATVATASAASASKRAMGTPRIHTIGGARWVKAVHRQVRLPGPTVEGAWTRQEGGFEPTVDEPPTVDRGRAGRNLSVSGAANGRDRGR